MTTNLVLALEIVVGVALSVTILLQAKGTGISGVFGGSGESYRSRRGVEKLLHRSTIFLSVIFMGLALVNILLSR